MFFRKRILILTALFIPVVLFSCKNNVYITQHFTYPPNSEPHLSNWEYTMLLTETSNKSPITKRSKKNIELVVYNKDKKKLMRDSIEFEEVATVKAQTVWEKFETINVKFVEEGNKYSKDPYNIELVKSGPNELKKLSYCFDKKEEKFKRCDAK